MNVTKVSKFISLILRHKPEEAGISLNEHGWANVNELIVGVAKKYPDFNIDILEEIVATDEKQRYSFNDDHTLIRANQGHSIDVDVELEEVEPPEQLYHGTAMKNYFSIMDSGIESMTRLYVHLSPDVETAKKVGARHGEPVVFCVDAESMYKKGYKFYKSKNGVWLTKYVPYEFILYSYEDKRKE